VTDLSVVSERGRGAAALSLHIIGIRRPFASQPQAPSTGPLPGRNFHDPILSNLHKGEDEPLIYQENVLPGK